MFFSHLHIYAQNRNLNEAHEQYVEQQLFPNYCAAAEIIIYDHPWQNENNTKTEALCCEVDRIVIQMSDHKAPVTI